MKGFHSQHLYSQDFFLSKKENKIQFAGHYEVNSPWAMLLFRYISPKRFVCISVKCENHKTHILVSNSWLFDSISLAWHGHSYLFTEPYIITESLISNAWRMSSCKINLDIIYHLLNNGHKPPLICHRISETNHAPISFIPSPVATWKSYRLH